MKRPYGFVCSFKGERLAEHSYLTLRIYVKAFGQRYERVVARKLGIEVEEFSRAFRLSCLLHDVGKACRYYQRERMCESFRFHEVVSAYVVYGVLERLEVRRPLAAATALAVLQHHQAMRSFETLVAELGKAREIREAVKGGFEDGVLEELDLAAELARACLPEGVGWASVRRELERVVSEISLESVHSTVIELVSYAKGEAHKLQYEEVKELHVLRKFLPVLVAPLQLSDCLAAALTREKGDPLKGFRREVLALMGS